jgi:small subunit ribosomal protein S17
MKIFEGIVVSGGKNNTVVVEVSRRTPHPLYKKLIRLSKKLKADTTGIEVVIGEKVKIVETRPISKDKYFKVIEIIKPKFVKKTTRRVERPAVEEVVKKPEVKKTKVSKKENK